MTGPAYDTAIRGGLPAQCAEVRLDRAVPPTHRSNVMIRTTPRFVPALLLAATVALAPGVLRAQASPPAAADDDHKAHHPADAAAAATPAAPAPGMGMGMMGGDMGPMMQQMMPMMRAMMARHGAARMEGPMAMMAPHRVEGRIAFLRTELAITDAQLPAWNSFADALRAQARSMAETRNRMPRGGPGTPMAPMGSGPMGMAAAHPFPDEADRIVQGLSARLEAARGIATAGRALYGALSDEQKKTADELLAMPMHGM